MSTCRPRQQAFQLIGTADNVEITYPPEGGYILTISNDDAPTPTQVIGAEYDPGADFTLQPTLYTWVIGEIDGIVGFGISFDNPPPPSIYGEGKKNLYYTSDGHIVSDGVIIADVPPLTPGDMLQMLIDPLNALGKYFLNGVSI